MSTKKKQDLTFEKIGKIFDDHVVNESRDDEQNQNIHDNSFHSRYEYLNDPKGPEFESD